VADAAVRLLPVRSCCAFWQQHMRTMKQHFGQARMVDSIQPLAATRFMRLCR
jgi:hypothetical protein